MKRIGLLPASLLPLVAMAQKPNVIMIVADDLGYGDISCYGATRISTPNVDDLARRGVRFTDAHCVASTSTPSRYGMLTGMYPFRKPDTNIAAGDAAMIIKPEQYTIADLFRDNGYYTAAIGKWHLGLGSTAGAQDWNGIVDQTPNDLGFDYSYLMAATADRVPCVFIEQGRVANYDPTAPIRVSYQKPLAGEVTYTMTPESELKLKSSHGHNNAIVNGIGRIGYMTGGGKALWKDQDIADSITLHALDFLDRHKDEPFFLYLATNDVHVPRYPHDRFRGKSPMGLRGDAIAQFDWTVGQVTAKLNELGLTDNTLIILTSDNGPVLDDGYQDKAPELAGSHRPGGHMRGGKYSSFEAGSTIPFIVTWPGHTPSNKVSKALFSQIDIMGSLAQLLGARLPADAGIDTRGALKAMIGRTGKGVQYNISMSANRSLTVRTAHWKYIEPSNGVPLMKLVNIETGYSPQEQLYDIVADPGETNNLATRYPGIVSKLRQIIPVPRQAPSSAQSRQQNR
ncbi:MAG: sulfatase-like hydrolase/transferase [Bacteroidaceae bacterium]|nr:sulfatase-like hydrolase/transferase [Bacteroidaceae bacterium]